MARTTVAELETRVDSMSDKLDHLVNIVTILAESAKGSKGNEAPKAPEKPKTKPWLTECPDYATAAQRAEYEKLAERAKGQLEAVKSALGTKTVTCFIPVPKAADKMPHTVQWKAVYSK